MRDAIRDGDPDTVDEAQQDETCRLESAMGMSGGWDGWADEVDDASFLDVPVWQFIGRCIRKQLSAWSRALGALVFQATAMTCGTVTIARLTSLSAFYFGVS